MIVVEDVVMAVLVVSVYCRYFIVVVSGSIR